MDAIERRLIYAALDQEGRMPTKNLQEGRKWMAEHPERVLLDGSICDTLTGKI